MSDSKQSTFLDSSFFFFCLERGLKGEEVLSALGKLKSKLCTNVKVLQEIVYYYHMLGETELGYKISKELASRAEVFSIGEADLSELDILLERYPRLKSRVLFHVGSMKRNKIQEVLCNPKSDFIEVSDVRVRPGLVEMGLIG